MSSPAGGAPMQRKRLSVQSTHSKPLSLHRDGPGAAVRWGIVGCGWVARDHLLPGLRATPAARLVGACDRDAWPPPGSPPGTTTCWPPPTSTPSCPGPGSTPSTSPPPTPRTCPWSRAVAARGIPVLCEKPLAADVDDAAAIVAACAGTLAGTAFDQRFHPAHRRIAEIVAAGELGTVTAVRIVYACWLPPDWSPDGVAARQLARRPGPGRRRRAGRPGAARHRPGRRAARR